MVKEVTQMFISLILPLKNLMMSVKSILLSKMISLKDKRNMLSKYIDKEAKGKPSRGVRGDYRHQKNTFFLIQSIDELQPIPRDSNDKVQVATLDGTNTGSQLEILLDVVQY